MHACVRAAARTELHKLCAINNDAWLPSCGSGVLLRAGGWALVVPCAEQLPFPYFLRQVPSSVDLDVHRLSMLA